MDIEKKLIHQCVLFWVLICDSAKNLESAKTGSQVVGKNVLYKETIFRVLFAKFISGSDIELMFQWNYAY